MGSLYETATRWLHAGTDPATCPGCGGDMESTYVRAPDLQDHWRGVPALECVECGYAEADE